MAYHVYGSDNYANFGLESENKLIKVLEDKGFNIIRSTVEENKKGIDLFVNGKSCDVKCRNSEKIHIELQLSNKFKGWLYKPTEFVIFHLFDLKKFIIIKLEDLRQYILSVNLKQWNRPKYNEERLVTININDIYTNIKYWEIKE